MATKGVRRPFNSLWKEYFRDPSQWWETRKSKVGPAYKLKTRRIDGFYTPSRVEEELTRSAQAQNAEPFMHNEKETHYKAQDKALCTNNEKVTHGKFLLCSTDVGNTLVAFIRACARTKDLRRGSILHNDVLKRGFLEQFLDPLVIMYAKCGALSKAQELLDMHKVTNVAPWTALIAGYAQNGLGQDALSCFERMQQEGLSPDAVTFASILKVCGSIRAIDKGEQIHDEISRQGLLENDIVLGNSLVDMYVKCGVLAKAHRVLKELPIRTVVSWSTLITGYAQQGQGEQALNCFKRMLREGLSPNAVTFSCILKACASVGAADTGKQIHDEITRQGLLGSDVVLGTALVDMYVKCGALPKAQQVLEELPVRNVVSWNALITGYAQQGQGEQALNCFEQMQREGLSPNARTFTCILNACASIAAITKGEEIHDKIAKQGLLRKDVMLGNALVDMYAKCGALGKAQQVLDELPVQNVVAWNALIAGYIQQGQGEQALDCFDQMQREGLYPNAVTFLCVLRACGSIGAAGKGEQIHSEIATQKLVDNDIVLGNAVVDMYAKCGALDKAQQVLDELPVRNVVTWSALIAGYALHGQGEQALNCFEQMQREGLSPNSVTFLSIFKACGSRALVDDAEMYFVTMSNKYGIEPNLEHCICMVDVYGRAGNLNKAVEMIQEMPSFENSIELWSVLLGACRKWGDVNVGRWAFDNAVKLDKSDAAAYILMANIFVDAGKQEDAEHIEAMRVENKAWKKQANKWWFEQSQCKENLNM